MFFVTVLKIHAGEKLIEKYIDEFETKNRAIEYKDSVLQTSEMNDDVIRASVTITNTDDMSIIAYETMVRG